MKIRQGFVSNSSSSSFICECISNPKDVANNEKLIREEILRDDISEYAKSELVKAILGCKAGCPIVENSESWEIGAVFWDGEFGVDEFVDCFRRNITIKEWLEEKYANKIIFDYSDDDHYHHGCLFEFQPEKYLKCKFIVQSHR